MTLTVAAATATTTFANPSRRTEYLITQATGINCCLHTVQILNVFRHSMCRACARCQNLQNAFVYLDVECENVAAYVSEDLVLDKLAPEFPAVLRRNLALIRAGEAIDGVDRMMAEHEHVSRIGMVGKRLVEPLGFNSPFASKLRKHGVDEHHQQIITANEVGEPFLI